MTSLKDEYGTITIDNNVIATVVGRSVTDNYGVVGMVSKNQLRDNVDELLRKENFHKGIVLHKTTQGLVIDVNVIIGFGVKISEVSRSIQAKVKYNLKTMLGLSVPAVNVIVQGVKVLK